MCGRLQYYCLVQIISRLGATWYQIQYGFRGTIEQPNGSVEAIAFAFELLLSPSAGVGYLIVFLFMQPEASFYLYELGQQLCCSCCSSCHNCSSLHASYPKRVKRRRGSRPSEDTVSSAMEQRILEDIYDDVEESGDERVHEKHSDGVNSWSSSYFLGDDQELAEELERLHSQRTGSGRFFSPPVPR
jgi:hypothetical protein